MNEFEFNEEKHEYKIDGIVVPSITQILSNYFDFSYVSESYRENGTREHKVFQNAVLNKQDKNTELYDKIRKSLTILFGNYNVLQTETPLYSKKNMFAGTPDAIVEARGKYFIIEYKSNKPDQKYVLLQLSAQRLLAIENKIVNKSKTGSLCLYNSGTEINMLLFNKEKITNAEKVFLKMLKVYELQKTIKLFLGENT